MEDSRVVKVEIHGQEYPIRSGLDPAYVAELASYVDTKMRLASRETVTGDTLKIAVLAAINIADECFRMQAEDRQRRDSLTTRAEELERMLDLALGIEGPAAEPLPVREASSGRPA
jgi:cell division protein ZapA